MTPKGYRVRDPSGGVTGCMGVVDSLPAMNRTEAEIYISEESEKLGLNLEDFELIEFETQFVSGEREQG